MAFTNWSSTKKGISLLLGGTVGAQLILLLSLPVLSRLFSPQEFGLFTLITSITSLILPLATLRLESATMLPSDQRRASALVFVSLASIFFTSVLSIFVLDYLVEKRYIESSELGNFGSWVGIFVFANSLFLLLSQIALRERKYGQVAKRTFIRSIAVSLTQLGLGVWRIFPNGLLIGGVVGQLVGLVPIAKTVKPYLRLPNLKMCGAVVKEYWRFPVVFTPSALLNSFGLYGPLIFFTSVYGVTLGGQLGMAERVISMPLALIGVAIGQVIDAEVAKVVREGREGLLGTFLRFSGILGILGVAIFLGGVALGPLVIPWLLGSSWELAGVYVQALALSAGLRLISSPLSKFLIILQESLWNTWLDVARIFLVGGSMIVISVNDFSALTAVWLLYACLAATYILSWVVTYRSVKRYESSFSSD